MEQKDMFDDEEGKSEDVPMGDELEDLREKLNTPKKGKTKLLLVIGLLLIVGAYAVNTFLLKKEEPVPPPAPARIPIKGAPVMANVTGVKAAPAKEVAKAGEKKEKAKVEAKKPEVKVAKKEEAVKPKPEAKAEKPAPKEVVKGKKAEAKPEAKRPAEVKVAKKEAKAEVKAEKETPKEVKEEGFTVVIGTYAAKYELEAALEKLKGSGVRHTSRETKKRLTMNRVLVKEVKDKGEVDGLLSELKEKGYDPFTVLRGGVYKVFAVSNFDEEISRENKADLEKLGYEPVIEKTQILAKAYELVAVAKSAKEAKTLKARLKKMGFRPEVSN